MGKQAGKKASAGQQRDHPAPYKKPRVEVSFDGPRTVKTKDVAEPVLNQKAKGKGKELPPQSTIPIVEPTEIIPDMPSTFIVIAGSYEKLLYGLEGSFVPCSLNPTIKPIFIFPAHLAYIKAIAASPGGKWLATGSEDEFVKVWDLRRRKEVGSLSQHSGSITSVHFPTSSHLITTSEDATLSLFRTSDWALLKSLKGHSGRVNHVDVHPTGKVALSVGKDKTLKMWDLMRGRGAASLPLGSEAEIVKFSPRGTHFAVLFPKKIEIYSLTLRLLHTLETKSRFNTMLFSLLPSEEGGDQDEALCVGTEKGQIEVYRVQMAGVDVLEDAETSEGETEDDYETDDEGKTEDADTGRATDVVADEKDEGMSDPEKMTILERVGTLVGHTNRIKSISALTIDDAPGGPKALLASVSTDGFINLYDLSSAFGSSGMAVEPVTSYDTKGTRLTTVFIAEGQKGRAKWTPSDGTERPEAEVASDEEQDADMYGSDVEDDVQLEGEDVDDA